MQEEPKRTLPVVRKFSEVAAAPRITFDYVVPGLRRGNVGVMAGYGGIGKGFFALAAAIDASIGGQGRLTGLRYGAPGKVLFVSIEDDQDALDARLQSYSRHLALADRAVLDTNLTVVSVYGLPGWQLLERGERGVLYENLPAIEALAEVAMNGRLIILDTARKFFAFDENKSDEASLALRVCDQLARRTDCALILVHHLVKPNGDGKERMPDVFAIRGSSALVADARWAAVLATPTEEYRKDKNLLVGRRYRVLDVGKVNHAGQPDPVLLEQDEQGALVACDWPAAGTIKPTPILHPPVTKVAPKNGPHNNFGLRSWKGEAA